MPSLIPCFNRNVDAGIWAALATVFAALVTVVVALLQPRAKARRSETDRVRTNLRKYIRDVSLAHRWLREDVAYASSESRDLELAEYREEAATRATDLYKLWDEIKVELQNPEITMALDAVQMSMDAALRGVSEGNLSPDLTELKERRDRLARVAKKRLAVRL